MKAEYLNPFVHATRNVLETMAHTKLTNQKPHLKEGVSTYGDVTGIIGMASESVEGSMTISFPSACILKIVSRMLMEEPKTTIDNDIVDAVGEITNMICGGAKAEFGKLGMSFNLATPTMVTGKGVEIHHHSDVPIIVLPFETDCGTFVLEANLASK
ncbi:MAG TPA: chemotaxis protein CheX [Desulfurivibrionaceae bacterium]|jgi:chemotaxis protein CheX